MDFLLPVPPDPSNENKEKKKEKGGKKGKKKLGNDLFSRELSSACECLTALFGKGRGVATQP